MRWVVRLLTAVACSYLFAAFCQLFGERYSSALAYLIVAALFGAAAWRLDEIHALDP